MQLSTSTSRAHAQYLFELLLTNSKTLANKSDVNNTETLMIVKDIEGVDVAGTKYYVKSRKHFMRCMIRKTAAMLVDDPRYPMYIN